jgi:uncharacterized integral membrane protein
MVALSAYLLVILNQDVLIIDFLFSELQVSTGFALLSFFLLGVLITLVLETIASFRRRKFEE